jgi:hypothetical protein
MRPGSSLPTHIGGEAEWEPTDWLRRRVEREGAATMAASEPVEAAPAATRRNGAHRVTRACARAGQGAGRTGRRAAAHEELPAYVSQKSRAGGTWAHWKESRSHVRQLSPEFRRQGYTQRGGGTAPRQKMPNLEGPYWVGVRPDSGTVA